MTIDKTPAKSSQVDMSPEAIDLRLREMGQLYKLGMALKTARRLGKVEELRAAKKERPADQSSRSAEA